MYRISQNKRSTGCSRIFEEFTAIETRNNRKQYQGKEEPRDQNKD